MIPEQRLSTTTIQAAYESPDDESTTATTDYELGGIGLNDPSAGLRVQTWTLTTDGTDVKISAPTHAESVLFSGTDITEVSLAFDQNMRPFVAFVEGGVAKFRWYDTLAATNTITSLPSGATSPRCCLDDRRDTQRTASDIIIAYLNAGSLYFRAQRDRYEDEYLLATGVLGELIKVGMNKALRLQFMLRR